MLLNLSNHSLKNWNENQLNTAKKLFGSVSDLLFPQIPPEADENYITSLAKKYCDKCLNILSRSNDKNNAVHIMGEMTFTFALVDLLLKHNIICVASTTERNTIEINGKKVSEFRFVRFRRYINNRAE